MFTVLSITNNKKILNTILMKTKFQNPKLFKRQIVDGKKKKIYSK